jgi:hypothetical protein
MKPLLMILLSGVLAAPSVSFSQSPSASGGPAAPQSAQFQTPDPDAFYHLGPDSPPQDGVPKGEIRGPFTLRSFPRIRFEGTGQISAGRIRSLPELFRINVRTTVVRCPIAVQ